jgi:phosphoribosylglycinamide formyltransferase-1
VKIGILASGGGTNVQALLDAGAKGDLGPGKIAVVGVNVPGAGALARATAAGVPTFVVDHRNHSVRLDFDRAVIGELRAHDVQLVVLAGFMRLVTPELLSAFPRRIINIHPALLPAFPGLHGQAQALRYGVKLAGCTVHFVDEGTDSGPIIAQSVVPVLDDDDDERLQRRILAEEHRLLPLVVRAFAEGRVVGDGRRVRVLGAPIDAGARLRSL